MTPEGKALSNIVILGFGFMLMFTAFQTCGNIEVAHLQQKHNTSKVMNNDTVNDTVTVKQVFEYEWILHVGVILCQLIFHFLFSKLLSRV